MAATRCTTAAWHPAGYVQQAQILVKITDQVQGMSACQTYVPTKVSLLCSHRGSRSPFNTQFLMRIYPQMG